MTNPAMPPGGEMLSQEEDGPDGDEGRGGAACQRIDERKIGVIVGIRENDEV